MLLRERELLQSKREGDDVLKAGREEDNIVHVGREEGVAFKLRGSELIQRRSVDGRDTKRHISSVNRAAEILQHFVISPGKPASAVYFLPISLFQQGLDCFKIWHS